MLDEVLQTTNEPSVEQEKDESSSDSDAYHRYIHVDVHHHKVTKDAAENVNNNVLQPCHLKK